VISSPTQDVSGGTVLLRMADLTAVLVRTLVDETDIGKIKPGMTTRVTVAAYPNQPFDGDVLKIEPQAIVEQNVTMFAVLIRLENLGGLLKPGMNADVEIQIASRDSVAVIPTMALRADSDIPTAALMLGMDEAQLRGMLGAREAPVGPQPPAAAGGVSQADVRALVAKRRNGETLSAQEEAVLQEAIQRFQGSQARGSGGGAGFNGGAGDGGGMGGGAGFNGGPGSRGGSPAAVTNYQFGGDYWVVAVRDGDIVPVPVRTGVTDLAFSEVVSGLQSGDEVLLLPSSSLFEQQEALQSFISARYSSTPFQSSGGGGGRFR